MTILTDAANKLALADNNTRAITESAMRNVYDSLASRARGTPQKYADLKYDGMTTINGVATFLPFHSGCDDSANFTSAYSAVANDADGVCRMHLGPGYLNLSGLTTGIQARPNQVTEIYCYGTQVIGANFPSGTSSHPVTPRIFARMNKGAFLRIILLHEAQFHGWKGIISENGNASIYASKADWGQEVPGFEILNFSSRRCTGGIFFSNYDTQAGPEEAQRVIPESVNCRVTSNNVGDSVTPLTVTLNSMPLRSDTSLPKIQKDDIIGFRCQSDIEGGQFRRFRGTVASTHDNGDGTWNVTFQNALPTGYKVLGAWSTTLTGTHGTSTGCKLTVATTANMSKGNPLNVTYDDATTAVFSVYDVIDATTVMLSNPLTKTASSGNAVSFSGSLIMRTFKPAVTYKKVNVTIARQGVEILPTSENTNQRLIYCGNTQNTVVIEDVSLACAEPGAYVSGCRHFTMGLDSVSRQTEFWQKKIHIDGRLIFRDYMSEDLSSGGQIQLWGPQQGWLDGIHMDGDTRRSVNQFDCTLAADVQIGQHYVELATEVMPVVKNPLDMTALVKCGYSISASGEPNTSTITPINVNGPNTNTTVNGALAIGATTMVVASGTGYVNGDVISFLAADGTQRYNSIVSGGGTTTWVLFEALDKTVNDTTTVSRLRSNKSSAANRGETNTWLVRFPVTSPTRPVGTYFYGRVVAADFTRGPGHGRLYFQDGTTGYANATQPGVVPGVNGTSGTIVNIVDNNFVPINGDEPLYFKGGVNLRNCVLRNMRALFQGGIAFKGGEEGNDSYTGTTNNDMWYSSVQDLLFINDKDRPTDTAPPNQIAVYIQTWGVTVGPNVWWDIEAAPTFSQTHNATATSKIKWWRCGHRGITGAGPTVACLVANAGHDYEFTNVKREYGPNTTGVSTMIGVHHTNTAGANDPTTPIGDAFLFRINDMEFNSTRALNEDAGSGTGSARPGIFTIDGDYNALSDVVCMRDFYFDGHMGRSNFLPLLEIMTNERIKNINFGARTDISGLLGTKADLIKFTCNSSGVSSVNPQSTVTVATQTAGDMQVSIDARFAYNIDRGSRIWVTLDDATILKTHVAEDTGNHAVTGVIKLMNPIPVGRSVANGAAVTFRPTGEIRLANPAAFGYEAYRNILVPAGVSVFDWSIAGIFTRYRHMSGYPGALAVTGANGYHDGARGEIRVFPGGAGDILGLNFNWYVDPTDVTNNVANDATQAGGKIRFNFINPTTGAPRNMNNPTLLRVGFKVPAMQFTV